MKNIKNLEINKEFVTNFFKALGNTIVVCTLVFNGVVLFSGIKAEIYSRKNSNSSNTKNNKQYEEKKSETSEEQGIYDVSRYLGYHLEGDKAVKNIDSIKLEKIYSKILSGDYQLVEMDDQIYVRLEEKDYKPAIKHVDESGNIHYSVEKYPGYILVGDKGVRTYTTLISVDELSQAGYNIVEKDGQKYAERLVFSIVDADVKTYNGKTAYNLNAYPGYTLVGDKGIKILVERIPIEAEKSDDKAMIKK